MSKSLHLVFLWVAFLAIACVPSGCANPKYPVSGSTTRDGKPLEWKSDEGVLDVKFVPLDRERDRNVYRAETDRTTGTYTIVGIPPGSYRVSIQQMDPYPTHDLLGFALGMRDSPIIRPVAKDKKVIDIDLPRDLPKKGGEIVTVRT
jgi:hypothetical protein